jgi:hypothetical protein
MFRAGHRIEGARKHFAKLRHKTCKHFGVNPCSHRTLGTIKYFAKQAEFKHYSLVARLLVSKRAKDRELLRKECEAWEVKRKRFDASIAKWKHEVERFEAIWPKHLRAERHRVRASKITIDDI